MAFLVNRSAIVLNLVATFGFAAFCISIQAPMIQQEIYTKCLSTLESHRIPTNGLSVDGRDVLLTGPTDSPIISPRAVLALEKVSGVRRVKTHITYGANGTDTTDASNPPLSAPPSAAELDLQAQIDQLLQQQNITFQPSSATLTAESELLLDKIATYLAQSPHLLCEIRGYNNQPREIRSSWVLALQRALTTEDYLETKGISDWRLSTRVVEIDEEHPQRAEGRIVDLLVRAH